MEKIFSHPKSTLLGILVAVLFGLVGLIHNGHLDLLSLPDTTTAVPMLASLVLGAISTDNSALVKLFFSDWQTTAIGLVSAVSTAVLGTLASGKLSNRVLAMSAVAAIFGWVSQHKEDPPNNSPPTNNG
ncbi:MAG: hypothetical protein U0Y68_18405 [Blastocatellia bacterium]